MRDGERDRGGDGESYDVESMLFVMVDRYTW